MKTFREIEKLKKIYFKHNISFKQIMPANKFGFTYIEITIGLTSWKVYIDDEYEDFSIHNPLVDLFLTLSSLEEYQESEDYLNWCHHNLLDASDLSWLNYYKTLEKTFQEIKNELGEIDSCISSLDYQLRTGIIDALIACEV